MDNLTLLEKKNLRPHEHGDSNFRPIVQLRWASTGLQILKGAFMDQFSQIFNLIKYFLYGLALFVMELNFLKNIHNKF